MTTYLSEMVQKISLLMLSKLYFYGCQATLDTERVKKRILPLQIEIEKLNIESIEREIDENEDTILSSFYFMLNELKAMNASLGKAMDNMLDVFLTSVTMFLFVNVVFPLLFLWGGEKLLSKSFNFEGSSKAIYLTNESTKT